MDVVDAVMETDGVTDCDTAMKIVFERTNCCVAQVSDEPMYTTTESPFCKDDVW